MKANRFAATTFALAGLVAATGQQAQVGVPVTGYVADASNQSIRSIQGLPGSAVLSDPLKLPVNIRTAWIAPAADFALVSEGAASAATPVLLTGLGTSTPAVQLIDGILPDPGLVAFNASGTAAILYSKAGALAQWVSGLPNRPVAGKPRTLSAPAGSVTALALDAGGRMAVAGYSDGAAGGVLVLANDESDAQWIAAATKPIAVTFVNRDRDVAFADALSNQLVLIQDPYGARTTLVLAGAADGLVNPVGLQSVNGTLVAAASGSTDGAQPATLIQFDLAAQRIASSQTLPLIPSRLADLSLRGVFVMNEIGPTPLHLFSAGDSSVAFVPVRPQP